MNKESALKITSVADNQYDFFINMDNIYLNTEIKSVGKNDEKIKILKLRYKFSMILLGFSIINYYSNVKKQENEEEINIEKKVEQSTSSISAVILPIIESMSEISIDDVNEE